MTYPFFTPRAVHVFSAISVCALFCWPLGSHAQAGAACIPEATDIAHRNACAIQRFQSTDSAHQILYADVMRALSAHERPALRKDQNLWSRQRAAQCKAAHAQQETLPQWTQLYHACLTEYTQQRRAALMHWLHHGQAAQSAANHP